MPFLMSVLPTRITRTPSPSRIRSTSGNAARRGRPGTRARWSGSTGVATLTEPTLEPDGQPFGPAAKIASGQAFWSSGQARGQLDRQLRHDRLDVGLMGTLGEVDLKVVAAEFGPGRVGCRGERRFERKRAAAGDLERARGPAAGAERRGQRRFGVQSPAAGWVEQESRAVDRDAEAAQPEWHSTDDLGERCGGDHSPRVFSPPTAPRG